MKVRVLLFAYLRERHGASQVTVDVADGATVADVWTELSSRLNLSPRERIRVAVNEAYVDNSYRLQDNDELALIPPVSGGAGALVVYRVDDEAIDLSALLEAVGNPAAGGTVLFVGTTRDQNEGRAVLRLEYEAYRRMAVAEMARIGAEIERRWPVTAVAMVHRIGLVPIAEASVAVAVSAPHRDAAFAACRYGIDTLKATVPIWKKEHYRGGEVWIGSCDGKHAADPLHLAAECEGGG